MIELQTSPRRTGRPQDPSLGASSNRLRASPGAISRRPIPNPGNHPSARAGVTPTNLQKEQ